jgi:hypothetical protein
MRLPPKVEAALKALPASSHGDSGVVFIQGVKRDPDTGLTSGYW